MATSDFPAAMDPAPGAGGSNWERDIHNSDMSQAKPVYNTATGQWEWRMPDGSRLGGDGAGQNGNSAFGPYQGGYRFDPSFMPPPSLQDNETYFGPGGGGSRTPPGGGGGNGAMLPPWMRALPAIPGLIRQFSGANNTAMSPELQQLLALALKRMSSQQGLFDAINQQALAGLPNRQG